VTFALVPVPLLAMEPFAGASGLHPELVRRLVSLGLLEASEDARGELWFSSSQVPVAARIRRLRAGLPLNYAAVGLVIDLLDRIAELEAALHTRSRPHGGRT
jgi:chaperone modulatory protein CbpM